jgi:3-deoxy-D-arabino-heptulosonate 7-phosphate (DAHP) synthase class II
MKNKNWSPDSWKNRETLQQPTYNNKSILNEVVSNLKKLPPIVFEGEVNNLKENYQTFCDPRLNYNQSMEMAFLISKLL